MPTRAFSLAGATPSAKHIAKYAAAPAVIRINNRIQAVAFEVSAGKNGAF
jgi:hypothetical protein